MEPMIADLALILICAGVMTLIFKRLKQPLVLGYIVAGFLASPNMPYMPSVTDLDHVHLWSDIGVIFLLFALGLEFSFKKIMKMGSAPIIAAMTVIMCMMAVGFATGSMFGWSRMDCLFLGGMLAMSSTTIIFKAFDDMGLRQQRFASLVLSVLIIEDILAIVLMVMLSTLAVSQQFQGMEMLMSIMKLVFFLILWFVVGIYLIPLFLKSTRKLMSDETLLIVALGLCFGMVVFASSVGFSPAFGAFIMGSILAETIEAEKIEHLVSPVKDLFGAIFFVSVGMMVDVQLIAEYAVPIICIILAILFGQTIFGTFGFLLSGQPLKVSMQCSFSLTQIGEFAFILATLGTSLGVTSNYLYPIVVTVSVFTTFTTPYMIRAASPAYAFVDKRMPATMRRLIERYASGEPSVAGSESYWRSYLMETGRTLLIYGVLCVAVVILMMSFGYPLLTRLLPPGPWDNIAGAVLTLSLMSPFLRALMVKRNHSEAFSLLWQDSHINRAPLVAMQLLRVFMGAGFVSYVIGHTLHWGGSLLVIVVVLALLVILLSRALQRQGQYLEKTFTNNLTQRERQQKRKSGQPKFTGNLVERDIHLADISIPVGVLLAGKTLAQLNLGHRFGVHAVAIIRGGRRINIPTGDTVILPGDRLQVIGSDTQLSAFSHHIEEEAQKVTVFTEPTPQNEMKLKRIAVSATSPLVGRSLKESGIRQHHHCLVVGIENGAEDNLITPAPTYVLKSGDIIWTVGEEAHLAGLEEENRQA